MYLLLSHLSLSFYLLKQNIKIETGFHLYSFNCCCTSFIISASFLSHSSSLFA